MYMFNLFGSPFAYSWDWIKGVYSGLPETQKRQDATQVQNQSNTLLQLVGLMFAGVIAWQISKKL